MINSKLAVRTALLGAALASSPAWASGYWTDVDQGSPHAAGDAGTVHVVDQQEKRGGWDDWFWKGHTEGMSFRCNTQDKSRSCSYTVQRSTTKSTTIGFGGGVEGGAGTGDWFKKVKGSLEASFNFSYQKTRSNSISSTEGTSVAQGQWVEPVMIQHRVWQRGHFMNGWVMDEHSHRDRCGTGCYYHYAWTGNVTYGAWTTNTAVKSPYHTFHFSSRPL
ncbi:hypothetical protein [Roseateles sp.]|uniref:hypothetical protein n=1 Tax=Roseateles sp. TaxID=1971397 RepID=UPI0031DE3ADE